MRRNPNLVPLSRDHHYGLLCSWKIKEGIKKRIPADRIKNYVNYFWHHHLSSHFEIEDKVLPEVQNEMLQIQMEKEHKEISKLINSINQSASIQLLQDFALALQKHIRFEERVVFPNYELHLSENELNEIGYQLNEIHVKGEDLYTDEFWK